MRGFFPLLLAIGLGMGACSSEPGPEPTPDLPSIDHSPVLQAVEATDVGLAAVALDNNGEELADDHTLHLHYRVVGQTSYSSAVLDAVDGIHSAVIPATDVTIEGVEYYLSLTAGDAQVTDPADGEDLPYRIVVSSAALTDPAPLRAHYDPQSDAVELTWTASASSAYVGYTLSVELDSGEVSTVCSGGDPAESCSVPADGIYDQEYATWSVTVADNEGNGLTAVATTDGLHLALEAWGKEVTPESPLASGAEEGEFFLPYGIATSPSRFHVIEQGNHRLQTFSNTGLFQGFVGAASGAGVPGDQPGEFDSPHDVAIGTDGNLYVADHSNARIQILDGESHQLLDTFGEMGEAEGQLRFPIGLAFDPESDTLHILESVNARVSVFDPADGSFIESYSSIDGHTLQSPTRITWLEEFDSMAIADGDTIYLASQREELGDSSWPITESETGQVAGMCTSPWGETWVALDDPAATVDSEGHRLLKFDASGTLVFELGEWGVQQGQFWRPVDCDVQSDGSLYVVEALNHRVQVFGP